MVNDDNYFMKKAIAQARKAAAIGEVPIGCVIVCDNEIVGRGYNKRNKIIEKENIHGLQKSRS